MARVIISAGHTQQEPGAVVDGLREVDFTRKIANKVTSHLRNNGIITLSVPPELELLARIDWINKTGYREDTEDICIEIHINDGGKSGIEGWHKDKGENDSYRLTKHIVNDICVTTGFTNQGVKSEYDHELKTLAFLHNTNPTSALIECLYIDNPEDQKHLKDESKLDLIAQGIVSGIKKFFKIEDNINAMNPTNSLAQPKVGAFSQQTYPQSTTNTNLNQPYSSPYPSYRPSFTPYSETSQFQGSQSPTNITRDQRKKMIQDNYQKILGKKVNDQDLNYFLNLGLNEDQMIKRLVESQDHVNLVKHSQKYQKIKPKYEKLKSENKELKSQIKDKEEIIAKQNDLISQKNKSIQQVEQKPQAKTAIFPDQSVNNDIYTNKLENNDTLPHQETTYNTRKKSLFDKIMEKLNDIFD